MIEKKTWLIGDDTKNEYLNVCKEASENPEVFAKFKQDPRYTPILEHCSAEMGRIYFDVIRNQYPELFKEIELFQCNDAMGGADVLDYDEVKISPSTLRYVKILGDLIRHFGDLSNFNVAEIGAGYGGQCLVTSMRFPLGSYALYDLPEVQMLIDTYLKMAGIHNFECLTLDDEDEYDLVISNYAFSECNVEIQDRYIKNVIAKSKRGFMIINAFAYELERKNDDIIHVIREIHPDLQVEKDYPTYHDTRILVWGK